MADATLPITSTGMVQTGPGQFVNANSISDQGRLLATNYQANKDTVSPTVMTNANPIEKIPETINTANTMLGSSTTGGNSVTDGSKGTGSATGSAPSSWEDVYKNLTESLNNDPVQKQELDLLNNMKTQGDATTQAQIANIHSLYADRANRLKESQASQTDSINNALTLAGANRYAPVSSSGILTAKERYDAQTLSGLQSEENQAVVAAQMARDNQNYQLLSKNLDILKDVRDQKFQLAKELATNMMNENKTQAANVETAKNDALKLALQNHAPKSVTDAISAAKTSADAYAAAVGYGGKANNEIVDINGDKALVDKDTGKIIRWIGGAGGGADPTPSNYLVAGATPAKGGAAVPSANATGTAGTGKVTAEQVIGPYKDFLVGRSVDQVKAFQSMSKTDQSNIQSLVDGDTDLATLFPSRGVAGANARQRALDLAKQVDPTYSPAVGTARVAFIKGWNDPNGKAFLNRSTVNTALGHIAELKEAVGKLDNSTINKYNSFANFISKNVGNSAVPDFDTIIQALASEYAGLYKGSSPTDEEIGGWKTKFESDYSPSTLNQLISRVTNLASDRINSTTNEYKNAMGKYPTAPLIQEDSLDKLKAAGVDTSKLQTIVNKSTGNNAVVAPTTDHATTQLIDWGNAHPDDQALIKSLITDIDPTLNRVMTPQEALSYLEAVGKTISQ